jgi:hypothetical protein
MKSLYSTGKDVLRVSFILLFIVNIALASLPGVYASPATVISVDPIEYEAPAIGYNFLVNVTITNITRMGSFMFKLGYNNTLLEATMCYTTSISDQYSGALLPSPWNGTKGIDHSAGYVVFGGGYPDDLDNPYSGSGALLTINFTATAAGNGTLDLYDTEFGYLGPPPDYDTYLIEHDVVDGSVTVIPEFSASIFISLFLITTLVAVLGKFWSRKHKDTHC